MGGLCGNVLDHTGYACMLQSLAKGWVSAFSAERGTTSPTAPFGIVTLADGTWQRVLCATLTPVLNYNRSFYQDSLGTNIGKAEKKHVPAGGWEGNPANAGQMHWAETLNYGVLPNPALPNGFVATAHDVGAENGAMFLTTLFVTQKENDRFPRQARDKHSCDKFNTFKMRWCCRLCSAGDPWNEQGCRHANCCNNNVPVSKNGLFEPFISCNVKTNILPRQARDKDREGKHSKKSGVFPQPNLTAGCSGDTRWMVEAARFDPRHGE
jgi:hypothetical protein